LLVGGCAPLTTEQAEITRGKRMEVIIWIPHQDAPWEYRIIKPETEELWLA